MERQTCFSVHDYDLAATLECGQAFRWRRCGDGWEGVIGQRWVRLLQNGEFIKATTVARGQDWQWLRNYLRLDDDYAAQLASFPDDEPLRVAVAQHRGLRLLRQEPWECLASFILSSTKQIVQIRQCVERLCSRYGEVVGVLPVDPESSAGVPLAPLASRAPQAADETPAPHWFAFPTPQRLAATSEAELRECKLGFRAKYLHATAQRVAAGQLDLAALRSLPLADARAALMQCPGVGRKIADCALLFSLGFDAAFPIDVWVERALRELYFPRRRVRRARLEQFAATHFGPHAGLAQQYLFHSLRTRNSSA